MPLELTRFGGFSDGIELEFFERERTPTEAMQLGIRLHLNGLSLAKTVSILEAFGIDRSRTAVHNWVHKAGLEPESGRRPDKVALDETVVKYNGERFWLHLAVDVATGNILHVRLFPTRTIVVTKLFLRELADKHHVNNAEFLVDGEPWLHAGLFELGMHFRHETCGDRNPVERSVQEIKRRTDQFYNCFPRAEPETAEAWL